MQLSQDHCFDHTDQRSRLTRAVGLDDRVRIDFLQGELHIGDVFVLTSDGVHGVLKRTPARGARARGRRAVGERSAGARSARCRQPRQRDGSGACACAAWRRAGSRTAWCRARQLPVPRRLKVGVTGSTATRSPRWSPNTGVHRLYQARSIAHAGAGGAEDAARGRARATAKSARCWRTRPGSASRVAPSSGHHGDAAFVRVRESQDPSAFYTVFDWHAGRTLEQLLAEGRRFEVPEIVDGTIAVARALGRLHRHGVIHRDIKPANLHLGDDGQWRVLDLGVAVSGSEPKALRTLHAGTPSYMNPEQWSGDEHVAADAGSDLYALGVTLYQWLTGKLPYGEVEPYQTARFRRDPKPPSRLRPDVPIWLDHVVLKAIALDPKQRFETAEEMLLALERGASRPLLHCLPRRSSRATRPRCGRSRSAVSLLFNLLLVYWLLFLPQVGRRSRKTWVGAPRAPFCLRPAALRP